MEVMETFQVLRRRRLLTSALLLLTVAGTVGAAVELPWTYQAIAQTVLLNSNTASKASGDNPYLAFDPSLTQTANVLCLELMDPRTAKALASEGYSAGYQVAVNSLTGGPVVQITVTGSNAGTVERTLSGVTDAVSTKLLDLQNGIAPQNRITSTVLSAQPTATRSLSKKAKPLVAVLGVGLVLTFAIPQLVNGVVLRRRRRHSGTSVTSSSTGAANATSLSQPDQHDHAPVARDASTHAQWEDPSETFSDGQSQSQSRDQYMPHERAGCSYRDNPANRSRRLSTAYFPSSMAMHSTGEKQRDKSYGEVTLMSLSELVALVRRHIVAVAIVLVVAMGVAYSFKHTPPTYGENATIVLSPPNPVLSPPYVNPYAPGSGTSLIITGEIMTKWMTGAQGQQLLRQAGIVNTFDVAPINFSDQEYPLYSEPNLTASATAEDPTAAYSALEAGIRIFEEGLIDQESRVNVPPDDRIAIHVIADSGPILQLGSSKRTYAGLAVLTIIGIYMTASFIDRRPSLLRRIRQIRTIRLC